MDERVTEFIGIYDADSTLFGELSYWIGARLGKRHCSLCDITHGLFAERADWRSCRDQLRAPFITFHRNDAPPDALACANGEFPAVFARQAGTITRVLGPSDLEVLQGSPEALVEQLNLLVSN
jgi:hypothetical protein